MLLDGGDPQSTQAMIPFERKLITATVMIRENLVPHDGGAKPCFSLERFPKSGISH
jgi:hypothetical protein